MKQAVLFFVCLYAISAFAVSEVQNGGGGYVSANGIETFISANLRVTKTAEDAANIPGLSRLVTELQNIPMKESAKGRLMAALYPAGNRKYYRVRSKDFDANDRRSFIEQYAQFMRVPTSNVVLFAVSGDRTTILFDEFYQLKESEQAAVLLHEALWSLNPLSYQQVISVEQAAQLYFENHGNAKYYEDLLNRFADVLADLTIPFVPGLYFDIATGAIPATDGKIRLVDLVGQSFVDGILLQDFSKFKTSVGAIDYVVSCNQSAFYFTTMSLRQHPDSIFYKSLLTYLPAGWGMALLSMDNQKAFMTYNVTANSRAGYEAYRDSLYVNLEGLTLGKIIYLNVYDRTDAPVGLLRF